MTTRSQKKVRREPHGEREPWAASELDVVALIHEFGHVFGAEHVDDTASIMHESFGYRTEFDAKNRSVIRGNRACPFAQWPNRR